MATTSSAIDRQSKPLERPDTMFVLKDIFCPFFGSTLLKEVGKPCSTLFKLSENFA